MKSGEQKGLLNSINEVSDAWTLERDVMQYHSDGKSQRRLVSAPDEVDILECWAGTMPFTLRCEAYGIIALEPGDLWSGWDYTNPHDFDMLVNNAPRRKPKLIVASVECTPWCWWNTQVNFRDRPELLKKHASPLSGILTALPCVVRD